MGDDDGDSDSSRSSDPDSDDFVSQSDGEEGQDTSEDDGNHDEDETIVSPEVDGANENGSQDLPEINSATEEEESVRPMAHSGYQSVSPPDFESRIAQMEKMLATIAAALDNPRRPDQCTTPALSPQQPAVPAIPTGPGHSRTAPISLEHIPKFPDNVPASKMWAELFTYLDQFNMALSLNNVVEPRKKTELLYLALGAQTQEVIRAAGLRPSNYDDPDCYTIFVTNIEAYFKSMTDPSAELLEFSSLKQRPGESTVQFFARVTARARLCGHSADEEKRHIRVQLLKGMANQDLAQQARTLGYTTDLVIQAATRCEAFMTAPTPGPSNAVMEVRGSKRPSSTHRSAGSERSRGGRNGRGSPPPPKRYHNMKFERVPKCNRCGRRSHNTPKCPAIGRKCIKCGKLDHFAVVCREKGINNVDNDVDVVKEQKEEV